MSHSRGPMPWDSAAKPLAMALVCLVASDGVAGEAGGSDEAASVTPARPIGAVRRIEKPRQREVFVPAGSFLMGVDLLAAGNGRDQCKTAFPSMVGQTVTGRLIDFCNDYFSDLTRMAPRTVFIDAFAIDRDEVTVDEYRRCVAAGDCPLDALVAGDERYIRGEWPRVSAT